MWLKLEILIHTHLCTGTVAYAWRLLYTRLTSLHKKACVVVHLWLCTFPACIIMHYMTVCPFWRLQLGFHVESLELWWGLWRMGEFPKIRGTRFWVLRWMVKILHDLSSGSVSDALRAVSPHPDVNVGEASGSCRIFSTRACRPFGSSGLNIKIQGLRGKKPVSRNRCRIYRSNSTASRRRCSLKVSLHT